MINLEPSEDQLEIVRVVADFLASELPVSRLRTASDSLVNEDRRKWREIGALGYFGLGLDERFGGIGVGIIEETLVFREYGRSLLTPAILGMTLGARVAASSGDPKLAAGILSGEISVALALPYDPATISTASTGRFQLLDATDADLLLTWNADGAALIRHSGFERIEALTCIDWTLALDCGELRNHSPQCWLPADVDDINGRALLLTAAMLTGNADGALHDSVDYVKERQQFGQPLGAFQSVKHRCADMATRVAAAWAITLFAALVKHQASPDALFQITAAKIIAGDAAMRNGASDIQNLGGMGFTGEQSAHLFLKRAHILDRVGGDGAQHGARFLTMRRATEDT